MKPRKLLSVAAPTLLGLGLGLAMVPAAWAQKQSSGVKAAQAPHKKSKDKKVWFNEDLAMLRKPGDMYAEPTQNAEEAARATQKEAQKPSTATKTSSEQATAPAFIPPSTLEEADKRLAAKKEEIHQKVELIENKRKEFLATADEAAVQTLTKEIEPTMRDLNNAQEQVKLLEASIEKLKSSSTTAGRL